MRRQVQALVLIAGLMSAPAWAQGLRVDNAWARATAPGQPVAGAFMDLTAAEDMTLTRAESPAAQTVELHTMRMEDGVMVMRPVKEIALPRGRTVSLKPGGLHIMLIGLKAPLVAGEKAPIRLVLKDGKGREQTVEVAAEVRAMAGGQAVHHH